MRNETRVRGGRRPEIERSLDAGEEVEREVAALPIVERNAREQVEAEAREAMREAVMPTSAEELIEATFGLDASALNDLQSRFVRDNDVHGVLTAIEDRLRRYCIDDSTEGAYQPSWYARLAVAVLSAPDAAVSRDRDAITEMHRYIVSEINPLLQRLHHLLRSRAHVPEHLRTTQGLLDALSFGEANQHRVVSAIGMLRAVEVRFLDVPHLSAEEVTAPRRIIIENPLDPKSTREYWRERLSLDQVYGRDATLGQLIAERSDRLLYELDCASDAPVVEKLRERIQNEGYVPSDSERRQLHLADACECIAQWADERAQLASEIWTIDQMSGAVYQLDFLHMSREQLFDVLNAAEVIKREDPQLMARMLGVAQSRGTSEASRSDLFGSVFHIAVARTLERTARNPDAGFQMLATRMRGLAEFDHQQMPLRHISEEQIRYLGREFVRAQTAAVHTESKIGSVVSSVFFVPYAAEYALQQMLDAAAETDRENVIDRLRVARPVECIRLLKGMPDALLNNEELVDLLLHRFDIHPAESDKKKIWARLLKDVFQDDHTKNSDTQEEQKSYEDALWRTTPSERLLEGVDLYEYMDRCMHEGDPLSREGLSRILMILGKHNAIQKKSMAELDEASFTCV